VSKPETPSVSIVVATHNRRDWLRLAIDSVLEQDYDDLELLVMDDGSTDGTPDLLREYQQRHPPERFRFSRHENMGQGRTLNRGYELARGDVLGYLSDDDLLAQGAVTRLVRELADPDVVAAYPGYHIIDDEGQVRDTIRPIEYSPLEAFRLIETVIGPGCLVRRSVLESSGGWDPRLHFMADFILWMRVGLAGRVVRVSEPLASWRRHTASITLQAGSEHGRELLRLVDLGAEVLGLSPDETAIRAEALRNACVQAAFHGGADAGSIDDTFATIDLTRPATSGFTGGIGRDEMPDERVDQVAELWRELALLTRRLAEVRTYGSGLKGPLRRLGRIGTRTGLKAALRRLHRLGLMDGEGEANPTTWNGDAMPMELIEAARECEADTDPATSRYLVLDRRGQKIPEEEFNELHWMGHRANADQLCNAIADRRRKLEAVGERPGKADL
jgi:glycosyltransferase involved in cell wall biosynthesis